MQIETEIVAGDSYKFVPLGKYVVRAFGVCGGRPTFKYTRIEVSGILGLIASGESMDNIVAGYRGKVPREALHEALELAAQSFREDFPNLTENVPTLPK